MGTVRTAFLVAVGLVALTACVSVQTAPLGGGVIHPPVAADKVAIYRTADQVHAKYEEVALLSASGDSSMTSEEQMFKKMRQQAGELGANGIILDSVSEPSTGSQVAHALLGTSADRHGKAVAIYVIPDTTAAR
jgi:hypothetical protein